MEEKKERKDLRPLWLSATVMSYLLAGWILIDAIVSLSLFTGFFVIPLLGLAVWCNRIAVNECDYWYNKSSSNKYW